MKLTYCTLTGVDEQTDLHRLVGMSRRFDFVEWGLLYSPSRQGGGRYPTLEFLTSTVKTLPADVRVALHICGRGVDQALEGEEVATALISGVNRRHGRVQLNFNQTVRQYEIDDFRRLFARHSNLVFITQHNHGNSEVVSQLRDQDNYAVLFDASGGRGLRPEAWPASIPGVKCGYAGGLGPDNIALQLRAIGSAAGEAPFWIDMEGKIRTPDDEFSLDACERVLHQVAEMLELA